MDNVAIMGGTFNPPHYGHLIIAQEVLIRLNLDKVIFIPTGNPPHKYTIDKEHRYNMTRLSIEGNESFEISRIELDRCGNTYTVDTLNYMKYMYKDIYFIIGADSLVNISKWKKPKEILSLCRLVCFHRSVVDSESYKQGIDSLRKDYNADIIEIDIPLIDVSSSIIRERVVEDLSIRYLLPKEVEEYIYRYDLKESWNIGMLKS